MRHYTIRALLGRLLSRPATPDRPRHRAALRLEALEDRAVPSATPVEPVPPTTVVVSPPCPSHDDLVEQKIKDIVPARAYPGVLTELALAALMEKIPSRQVRAALESWKDQDRWIPMLIDIFKVVQPN